MKISIIVAIDKNNAMGKDNQLPWHLPADLKHYKNTTMAHHMIMGRKTFESIGRLLPGRTTIIVTRNNKYSYEGALIANSIGAAIQLAKAANENEVFIVGGAEIYKQAIDIVGKIYITKINETFKADAYFPEISSDWVEVKRLEFKPDEKNKYAYSFIELEKKA